MINLDLRRCLGAAFSAIVVLGGCGSVNPATPGTTASPTPPAVTASPSLNPPTDTATPPPTQTVVPGPTEAATPAPPEEVPLTVELQFCSLEQGRDDVLALLDQLDAAVATADWEGAQAPADELEDWSFGWRAYVEDPVKSFPPTAAVALALAAALDLLDAQIIDIQGYSDVAGRPPPSAEAITAATTALRDAIDLIEAAITAVPDLACGVGLS